MALALCVTETRRDPAACTRPKQWGYCLRVVEMELSMMVRSAGSLSAGELDRERRTSKEKGYACVSESVGAKRESQH